ncbi:aromatic amino acid lyase, partial [Streptomyces asoensis]|uniref:aromatic amino acid lyase n=1 Tax=Streptomyces asoensis TaxID=249586 RepID=UPI003F4CF173
RAVAQERVVRATGLLTLLGGGPGRHGALLRVLVVRANQLLAGGSGIQPALVDALVEALRLGVHPAVNEYGGVGTGDLTALAQTGLALIGERPWLASPPPPHANTPPPDAPPSPSPARPPDTVPGPASADPAPAATVAAVGAVGAGTGDGGVVVSVSGPAVVVMRVPGAAAGAPGPVEGAVRDAGALPGPARLPAPVVLTPGDALALLSSNALALGQAALAQRELDVLLRATHAVAALSLAAVSGSTEAYAAPVHALRPYPGPARAAGEVRRLLGLPDRPPHHRGGRIQDPFGFRAFPQAHGSALDACERLRDVVEVEINCPSENPLLDPDGTAAYHHGGFFAAPLGLALDAANLALLQTAQLSAARLTALGDPGLTGLPAFLGGGPASSSGTMILEYTANSALAELRSAAAPASAGHAVLSRGLEEAASFAGQAARQSLRAASAYAVVVACELVAQPLGLQQSGPTHHVPGR